MKKMIRTTLTDLSQFIKRPNDEQLNINFSEKLQFLLILLSIEILFTFLVFCPLIYLIDFLLPVQSNFFEEDDGLINVLIFFILIAPISEELVFRFFLRYRKIYNRILKKSSWDNFFPFLVYLSSIAFASIHISNYTNESIWLYILAPIIVLSQAIGAMVIAFLRVRLSFIWAISYHGIWNFLFAIVFQFAVIFFQGDYIQQDKNYTLTIYPQAFYQIDNPQGIEIEETDNGKITKLEVDQHTLNYVIQKIYGKGEYHAYDDFFINVDFHSKQGITKQELLKVLQKKYNIKRLD